nr:MAG TPA: hypothetical protein [Caudoviricetes sp.]
MTGFAIIIVNLVLFIVMLIILKELSSLRVEYYNTLKVLSELNKHINYPGG